MRPVVGYEGLYSVSETGEVFSIRADKNLRPNVHESGHLSVELYGPGKPSRLYVHRLVLLAFVGSPPSGLVACHNDGDPANNRLVNLRWDTPESNVQDSLRHGTNFQAAKVSCLAGHPFTEANTYRQPKGGGGRSCRACRARRSRDLRARRRLERAS